MSTRLSVPRNAAASQKVRNALVSENVHKSSTRKKDRALLCTFTFADGRRCRTPLCSASPSFCFFHARKEAQARAVAAFGQNIANSFSDGYLTACELSDALRHLFTAAARGDVRPKSVSSLAYLGQVMLQTIQHAEHEYTNAFGCDSWCHTIYSRFSHDDSFAADPLGSSHEQPLVSEESLAPEESPVPEDALAPEQSLAPAPEDSLAPKESPAPGEPGLEPGSATAPTKFVLQATTATTAPKPTSTPLPPPAPAAPNPPLQPDAPSDSKPAAPPAPPIPAHLLPGFGKPANWEVLIPAKPIGRRNRHGLFRPWYWPE